MKPIAEMTPRELALVNYLGEIGNPPDDKRIGEEIKWWVFNSILADLEGIGLMTDAKKKEVKPSTAP